ncbi:MAG: Holliday junction branch migration protein RuvA [Oscillospiraceae bacterium]|jgi:Holliday junction DNA helicase RuvA|nr:Holliday junction branch migration protein RuvA [Oscillospiraceae bacterium]
MFYYLEGKVALIENGLAVIDINGAGYALRASARTLSSLTVGSVSRLYVYNYVREDAFELYGFSELSEKRRFELLLTVSGIGTRVALAILSSVDAAGLAIAIASGDERVLTGVPGIGKKLAARVILELKDKMAKDSGLSAQAGAFSSSAFPNPGQKAEEAALALAALGYTPGEVAGILRKLDVNALTVEELIRQALAE